LALAVKASRPARRETTATTTAATAASMIATAQATDETTAELVKSAVATIKSTVPVPEEAKLSRLQGSVSYYGMPAKKAKLILEGEASQIVLRADNQGNFSVENVEPGIYTLSTEAVVKNTFRYASRKLKIDHSGGTKTIDLDLQ
jgi:endonuclease III